MKHNRLVALSSLLALTLIVQLSLTTPPSAGGDAVLQPQPARKRTLNLPEKLDAYANIALPAHFKTAAARRFDNTPTDNPTTDAGATLGRVLFYDTQLSANKTFSCGSCHEQKHAFSEPRRMSKGFTGGQVDRNAMSLVELRFHRRGRFFWDERAPSLEKQVLMPIQNKTEMGQDLTTLVTWLEKDPNYPKLFARAFGDSQINSERIGRALAQFLRSLVSYQSRYDEGLNRVNSLRDSFPNFTNGENRGKGIFVRNCGVCHMPGGQEAIFTMDRPANNGLDEDLKGIDGGIGDITFRRSEVGKFKSPSLRNVEVTGPYMHDGRFATLAEVVEHYSKGVKRSPTLDPRMRGPRGRLDLSETQKADLIAFLKTLTDTKFLNDPKFSDPFR